MTIYAMKVSSEAADVQRIYASLREGEGRFGWSYVETADLRQLRSRIEHEGWEALNGAEQDCYQEFLLNLDDGDYVVYVNVPEWGQCTLARVTGPYAWRWEDDDYNHRFPVEPTSVRSFDRNTEVVPAALSARLKLRGRWWHIYAEKEFEALLDGLQDGTSSPRRSWTSNLRELSAAARPVLSELASSIHRTHPGKELEGLMEQLFRRVPGVKTVQRKQGRADRGADLLVEFEFVPIPGLVQRQTVAVQVKAFEGTHQTPGAVEDLRRAFAFHEGRDQPIDMGLVVSTAQSPGPALLTELDRLQDDVGKPVALLIGAELAAFFLQHAGDLLPMGDSTGGPASR